MPTLSGSDDQADTSGNRRQVSAFPSLADFFAVAFAEPFHVKHANASGAGRALRAKT
jgi:hypothetical protein